MVGSADPFQLFRIMHEVVQRRRARRRPSGVAFMLDQCHNIEPKIPAQIRSVMNVQEATAKALLVDRAALRRRRTRATCSARTRSLMDAYNTDVRPLLAELRAEHGARPGPDRRLRPLGLRRADRGRARRRRRRRDGAHEHEPTRSTAHELIDRSQPPGRRPAEHQLRRRQHVRQGRRAPTR